MLQEAEGVRGPRTPTPPPGMGVVGAALVHKGSPGDALAWPYALLALGAPACPVPVSHQW